ncbi:MAG: glycosyltransferase [Tannerella sp.]|jgi:glycosyltransferase involved in cell wall biosynthesis|nr:glycosyltransferase [Tannerella sp.]
MKVLFFINTVTPYFASIISKLYLKGIESAVVIPKSSKNQSVGAGVKTAEDITSFKIIHLNVRKAFYGKQKFDGVLQTLSDETPDIVVFTWPFLLQLYFDRSIIKQIKSSGKKLVLQEIPFDVPPYGQLSYFKQHPVYDENIKLLSGSVSFNLRARFIMHIRKYLYSRADGALNYISNSKDFLLGYGIDEQRIYVTFNSSDTTTLQKTKETVNSMPPLLPPMLRVIHIGRLVKWKRVDLLIDAFSTVLSSIKDVELLVVGDGPELEPLKKQAKNLNITSSVRFAGGVYDPETLGKFMLESSIYVLAGMGGLSINDAMTYGLPVICSVCDGTEKDLVRDGQNGFFFTVGDAADLADKMMILLNNKELIKKFGKKSEEIITNEINIDTVSERYYRAFKDIIGR